MTRTPNGTNSHATSIRILTIKNGSTPRPAASAQPLDYFHAIFFRITLAGLPAINVFFSVNLAPTTTPNATTQPSGIIAPLCTDTLLPIQTLAIALLPAKIFSFGDGSLDGSTQPELMKSWPCGIHPTASENCFDYSIQSLFKQKGQPRRDAAFKGAVAGECRVLPPSFRNSQKREATNKKPEDEK